MESYSQTLAMNDVVVNVNNERGYEMKNTAQLTRHISAIQ